MEALTGSGAQIVNALGGLFLLAILLRFLLQIAKADFYNPVSQVIVRVTNPVIKVFRPFIPGYKGVDFSTLLLALLVEALLIVTLSYLFGDPIPPIAKIITWSVVGIVAFIINIYYWAIIASIVMSFVMMFSGSTNPHPALRLIWQLTEPIMSPVRKIIPQMGGMDFSPIFIFIGIQLIRNLLYETFGITNAIARVVLGI